MMPVMEFLTELEEVCRSIREAKKLSRTVTAFFLSGYGTRESLFSADVGP
jgi:hypothetical protein